MTGSLSPASAFKLGSGVVTTGFSLFGGSGDKGSSFVQSPNPYKFDPYAAVFDPYKNVYDPYASNPSEGLNQAQYDSTNAEATLLEKQGRLAVEEAQRQATLTTTNAKTFREGQAQAYNASGVLLEGSPMMVLQKTWNDAKMQSDALVHAGESQYDLSLDKARIMRNEGRATLLGANSIFEANKAQYHAGMGLQEMQFQSQLLGNRAAYQSQGMTFAAQQSQQAALAPHINTGSNLGTALGSLGGLFGNQGASAKALQQSGVNPYQSTDPYGAMGGQAWGVP